MAFYSSSEEFYQVMGLLFQRLAIDPQAVGRLQHSRLMIRLRCSDPEAVILVDGRANPVHATLGAAAEQGRVDLELEMTADLLHHVWLGSVRLRDAFFGGQIKTTGNVFRAMQLADLFRRAEVVYPLVLRELGYQV